MKVKVSWDEGATFEEPCDLHECYPDDPDGTNEDYEAALAELSKTGRYWDGGGAAPLVLIMRVTE